jgi:hypothetical protein
MRLSRRWTLAAATVHMGYDQAPMAHFLAGHEGNLGAVP